MPFWHPNQLGRSPNLQITAESMKSISGELWFANNPRTNVLSVNRSHVWHRRLSFGSSGLMYDMHCCGVCRLCRLELVKVVPKIWTLQAY